MDNRALLVMGTRIAFCVSSILTVMYWGDWWAVGAVWFLFCPSAVLITQFLGHAFTPIVVELPPEVQITERSAEIAGRYMDNDIHEWIMLSTPEGIKKLFWEGRVDVGSYTPPENLWYSILDGLLYLERV